MIQYKMPPPEMEYVFVEEEIKNWDDFFDKYCDGRRKETGIVSRYVGYLFESTFFWREEDEYPFGYVYPNGKPEIDGKIQFDYFIRKI